MTHIDVNNSNVIPLSETDKEIYDRRFIWRKMGSKLLQYNKFYAKHTCI